MDEAFAHVEGSRQCKKGMVPPDGGWGYMVCIGVGFTFVSIFLFLTFLCSCMMSSLTSINGYYEISARPQLTQ